MIMSNTELQDQPPPSDALTDYDRAHLKLYMRLLDAAAAGADWQEAAPVLFGIDLEVESGRAEAVYKSHLARAKWMTDHGYRQLLAQ
jgi:Uncharacterized conserved protein (DUF2285)